MTFLRLLMGLGCEAADSTCIVAIVGTQTYTDADADALAVQLQPMPSVAARRELLLDVIATNLAAGSPIRRPFDAKQVLRKHRASVAVLARPDRQPLDQILIDLRAHHGVVPGVCR